MTTLTEQAAMRLLADRAFAPGPPGFVGAAVDLLLAPPGLPATGPLAERPPLRHGFVTARSARVAVVSGPPSPGIEACLARMADDLASPRLHELLGAAALPAGLLCAAPDAFPTGPLPGVLDTAVDHPATPPAFPGAATPAFPGAATPAFPGAATPAFPGAATPPAVLDAGMDPAAPAATAGVRVALEAGIEGGGPLGLVRRWRLAHTLAPVLAAAFANSPGAGWRSVRQARHRHLPVVPAGTDPRSAWAGYVLGVPTGDGVTFRDRLREIPRPSAADLIRHADGLRPPVTARGHLEIDVADRQAGTGWRVAVAVTAVLLDDARAAHAAEAATSHLAAEPRLWERAARHALTDPVLAAAARECFLAAYAALARQGAGRGLRDAVGEFIERYVSRGRCPADDLLSYRHVRG